MTVEWDENRFGHETDEMSDAARGFQNAPLFESKAFQRGVHPFDHRARRVMGIERGGAGGAKFIFGEQ